MNACLVDIRFFGRHEWMKLTADVLLWLRVSVQYECNNKEGDVVTFQYTSTNLCLWE